MNDVSQMKRCIFCQRCDECDQRVSRRTTLSVVMSDDVSLRVRMNVYIATERVNESYDVVIAFTYPRNVERSS